MQRLAKIATAAAVSVGVCFAGFYLLTNHNGNPAFAEVLEQMQQIKTLTWTEIEEHSISKEFNPTSSAQFLTVDATRRYAYKAPGHLRTESGVKKQPGGANGIAESVHIADRSAGKYLFLNVDKKTAVTRTGEPSRRTHPMVDYLTGLKEKITPEAESLGKKQIGDHNTVGFRVRRGGKTTDLWVDAKTRNLVLVLITDVFVHDRVILKTVMTLRDFEIDRELDDSLFSLDPPEGYQERPPVPAVSLEVPEGYTPPPSTENDLIDGLILWAEVHDRTFPPESVFKIHDAEQAKGDNDPHIVTFAPERYRAVGRFVRQLVGESWHYSGKGVKLGDKEAVVCWYRPEGSDTYRVVHGDLSIRDLAPDKLPKEH